jgi:hypothetical protein
MSVDSTKLPDDDRLAMIEVRAREWAEWMDVTASFTVQHGSFDGMEFPEPMRHSGHELGATFSSPDGKAFIVCISDKCPDEKLDHVIVHELVHVHTFEQSGPDEREVMETATDIAAQLVIDYRAATEQSKNDECQCPNHGNWIAADDIDKLTRELDVLLNGEEGAAPQASLCDIVAQVAQQKRTQQALSEPTDAISIRMAHVAALRAARDVPYLKENYTASSDELDSIADELEAEPIDA